MIDLVDIWTQEGRVAIKALHIDNKCPVKELLDDLEQKDENKVYALFGRFGRINGKITNIQKVRKLHFTCEWMLGI